MAKNYEYKDNSNFNLIPSRSVETENDEYSGFDFVKQSALMVNFTHEWERELREWDICDKDKAMFTNFRRF